MGKMKKINWYSLVLGIGWLIVFIGAVTGRDADWRFISGCSSLVVTVWLVFLAFMPLFRADGELER